MTVDFLSNLKERDKSVHEIGKKLSTLNCNFVIAAQDRDVALAAMVSFDLELPLVYLDQETQELNNTSGMWGKNGVLLADNIENASKVEPTLLKVTANGGKIQHAVLLVEPSRQVKNDLRELGITALTQSN